MPDRRPRTSSCASITTARTANDPSFVHDLNTLDIDLQHRFAPAPRHDVTWGFDYRFTDNHNQGRGVFAVDPPTSHDQLVNAFVQDQIAIVPALRVTIGTKVGHNDFSGMEAQPSRRDGAASERHPAPPLGAPGNSGLLRARSPARLERSAPGRNLADWSEPAARASSRIRPADNARRS